MNRQRTARIVTFGFLTVVALLVIVLLGGTVLGALGIDVHLRWP